MSNLPAVDGSQTLQAPSEFTWKGAEALTRVHALNERCLEVLSQLARSDGHRVDLAIINQNRSLLRTLSAAARRRAACTPFLVMDLNFRDAVWWRSANNPRPSRQHKTIRGTTFAGKIAAELARETLMLAWSTAAFDRGAASIMLGMAPVVTDIVARLGPQDVERIAARHHTHLRLRWDDFPAFWGKLLTAACDGDQGALHEIHLHGAQLIGGDLLPPLGNRSL